MQKASPSGSHRMASSTSLLFSRDMSFSGNVGGTPESAVDEIGSSVCEPACCILSPARLLLSTLIKNASCAVALAAYDVRQSACELLKMFPVRLDVAAYCIIAGRRVLCVYRLPVQPQEERWNSLVQGRRTPCTMFSTVY